jgi:hypothetical protein
VAGRGARPTLSLPAEPSPLRRHHRKGRPARVRLALHTPQREGTAPRPLPVSAYSSCCHTQPIFIFSFVFIKVVSASAGGSHCLFLTSSGRVYGMGTNAQGRLGLNHSVHVCRSPEFVSSLGTPMVPLTAQACSLTNMTRTHQSISTSSRWRPVFSVVLHLPKRCVIPLLSVCVVCGLHPTPCLPGLVRFPRARCSLSAATQMESSVWGPTRRP